MSNDKNAHEPVLPKAVRDQIENANKIYDQVYSPDKNETPDDPPADPPKKDDPPADPPKKDDPPADPPKKDDPPADDSWEHKFKVLKGKYDKEVPRLHRQLRDAEKTNTEMRERITALEATVAGLRKKEPEPDDPKPEPITAEEIEQFGPDLIDIIRRVAKSETGVVLDKQLKPIKQSVQQVNESVASTKKTVAESNQAKMLAALADAVPDWEQQNVDEDFLDWLDEEDPYSGKVRSKLLADAWAGNDAKRLIALFKGFQKENAVVDPTDEPSDETPAPEPKKDPAPSKEQPLDELVAPGTPKTGSTGAQNESGKKVWTQKEIREFYAYKNEFIKKFPDKELPEKVILQERDIFAAQHEGRIKP